MRNRYLTSVLVLSTITAVVIAQLREGNAVHGLIFHWNEQNFQSAHSSACELLCEASFDTLSQVLRTIFHSC